MTDASLIMPVNGMAREANFYPSKKKPFFSARIGYLSGTHTISGIQPRSFLNAEQVLTISIFPEDALDHIRAAGCGSQEMCQEGTGKAQTGGKDMSNISELELQNLRHLIGGYDTTHCKMKEYAQAAQDFQVKQFFEKGAQSAMQNKQQLMKFLG